MGNEFSYVTLGLKTWNAQIDRADKLFGGPSQSPTNWVRRSIRPTTVGSPTWQFIKAAKRLPNSRKS